MRAPLLWGGGGNVNCPLINFQNQGFCGRELLSNLRANYSPARHAYTHVTTTWSNHDPDGSVDDCPRSGSSADVMLRGLGSAPLSPTLAACTDIGVRIMSVPGTFKLVNHHIKR